MSTDELAATAGQVLEVIPLVMRTVAAELRRGGQSLSASQYGLLAMLARRSCSLSELAEHQSVSLATMSNSIQTLVDRGWATRQSAPHDRRKVLIKLTPNGERALKAVRRQAERRVAEILAPLSAAERESLLGGLSVLHAAFQPVAQAQVEVGEKVLGRELR